MKAIWQQGYGAPQDVLRCADADLPDIAADQVLVRVRASSANPVDWHMICGEPLLMRAGLGGLRGPKRVVGGDLAGVVERVGDDVSGFAPGDEVYGYGEGAFAEFAAVPAGSLARKPANLTFAQAASVPMAGITALQGLRVGGLSAGQHVLIIGASGGVGTFAVQIAKHQGAEVTGVCSTTRLDLVRSLGADHVIDYTVEELSGGSARYDLILQLGGTYRPGTLRRLLTPKGTLVQSHGDGGRWTGPLGSMAAAVVQNLFSRRTLRAFVAKETTESLDEFRDLIEAGHVTPVIDSDVPLEDAADAVALVKNGRPAGKVVVTVGGG